jgi:4-hydroxybenzoate polyprenyltransferase
MSSASRSSDVRQFLAFSRHREWLLGSLLPLFGTFFLAAQGNAEHLQPQTILAWCAVFLLGTGCGYMLNNLSDIEVDRRAGKPTPLDHWSYGARLGLALAFESASLALTLLLSDRWTLAAIAACHLIAWSYSFPPRFKEHVWIGPVVASAQYWAPSAVMLVAWRAAFPAALCWIAILAVYGLRITIVHQSLDRQADIATGVRTTAVAIGEPAARVLLRILFGAEVCLSLLLIVLLVDRPVAPITAPLFLLPALNIAWRRFRGQQIKLTTYAYVPLSELYETVVPLALALTALIRAQASLWTLALLGLLLLARHRERLGVVRMKLLQ